MRRSSRISKSQATAVCILIFRFDMNQHRSTNSRRYHLLVLPMTTAGKMFLKVAVTAKIGRPHRALQDLAASRLLPASGKFHAGPL